MSEGKRWQEADVLRGMAILMVLLYHSIIVFPLNLHVIERYRILHTFLWTVQMPLFFLVSGFCYSYDGNYRAYAWKKCRRILIPHIVFSALDIVPRLIPNPFVHEQMEAGEAIRDFVLYGGSDWFLWTLFVIVMVYPAFDYMCKGPAGMRKAAIFSVIALFLLKPVMPDLFLLNMISQYLLYFFLGYGVRRKLDSQEDGKGYAALAGTNGKSDRQDRKKGVGRIVIAAGQRNSMLLTGLLGMPFFFRQVLIWDGSGSVPGMIAELLCVFCSFLVLIPLAGMCRGRILAFFVCCGKWSLQMYLLDAYALVLTRTLLVNVWGIRLPWLIVMGNFLADTLIVLLLSKYILTKAKVFRIACGIPEKG